MLGASIAEAKPLGADAVPPGTAALPDDPLNTSAFVGVELHAPCPEFLRLIPYDFARRHLLLGLESAADGPARLAIGTTTNAVAVFNIGVAMKRSVVCERVDDVALAEAIDRAYAGAARQREREGQDNLTPGSSDPATPLTTLLEGDAAGLSSGAIELELTRSLDESRRDADLLDTSGKAAVVRLVDLVLFEAIRRGASDVHIQPIQARVLVRYRMDGVLHTVRELAAGSSLALAIITRIKVIARLDVAERRAPQDGRAAVTLGTS
ncbi:MAG: Flp pilus assembly complex ATPase component TadA, partial [Phycisphaerales bacterium]|nr:Flp pilus assembly complex ATPase component TadA [Phycisphaerales bacterium]